jgi:hypothetical protein
LSFRVDLSRTVSSGFVAHTVFVRAGLLGETTMRGTDWLITAAMVLSMGTAHALTADELVAKNIEARGGAEKLHAIQTLKLTGKLVVNGQFELAMMQISKRPAMYRNEASLQGLTAVQAYDGIQAWQIQPFGGRKDPEKLSADDAKDLAESADIDGPLVDYKSKGYTLDYLGTEDVDGTEAHKLKLTKKDGDIEIVYLDPDHFLEIRSLTQRIVHGVEQVNETDFGEFEKVNGVFLPFAIESGPKGVADKPQKISFDKAEINVPADDAIFHFPASAGAAK